jgi:hypothetical protein
MQCSDASHTGPIAPQHRSPIIASAFELLGYSIYRPKQATLELGRRYSNGCDLSVERFGVNGSMQLSNSIKPNDTLENTHV